MNTSVLISSRVIEAVSILHDYTICEPCIERACDAVELVWCDPAPPRKAALHVEGRALNLAAAVAMARRGVIVDVVEPGARREFYPWVSMDEVEVVA